MTDSSWTDSDPDLILHTADIPRTRRDVLPSHHALGNQHSGPRYDANILTPHAAFALHMRPAPAKQLKREDIQSNLVRTSRIFIRAGGLLTVRLPQHGAVLLNSYCGVFAVAVLLCFLPKGAESASRFNICCCRSPLGEQPRASQTNSHWGRSGTSLTAKSLPRIRLLLLWKKSCF